MIYRITFGFTGAGVGWSETHAMLNASNDPGTLAPTLEDIAAKRAQMLGSEFACVAVRAARYSTDGGVRQKGVKLIKKTWYNSNAGNTGYAAEPANVALMVRGDSLANVLLPQFDANENQTFLGGPIDECVDNAGRVFKGKRGLGAAFASWASAMTGAGMGWLASQTIKDEAIGLIVQNDNGTVDFTMSGLLTPDLVVGQTYRARVRRVNAGVSPLNGEIILTCTSATTLRSYEVIGIALSQVGGRIRIYKQVAPFIGYGALTLNDEVGSHKRGRPFGSKPGRARKRIRG